MADDVEHSDVLLLNQALESATDEAHVPRVATKQADEPGQKPPNQGPHQPIPGNDMDNHNDHVASAVSRCYKPRRVKRGASDSKMRPAKRLKKAGKRHGRYAEMGANFVNQLGDPVIDDFRIDWIVPKDKDGKPVRITASPARIPNPMDASPPKDVPPRKPRTEPKKARSILELSSELRLQVLRQLLVAEQPILVYGGWRLVYRRPSTRHRPGHDGPRLNTGILRTCKLLFHEACAVLYGENTFLYRLRDPSPASSNGLDDDDDGQGENHGHDVCHCFDVTARKNKRGPRLKMRPDVVKCNINVDKYSHLFRKIAVEAEHNRYSSSTMRSMTRALKIFGPRPSPQPALNIDTLYIRVAPRCIELVADDDEDDDDDDEDDDDEEGQEDGSEEERAPYTFVDFFSPHSPVLSAIRAVCCRFLCIDLMSHHHRGQESHTGCRLTLDRRVEVIANQVAAASMDEDDFWEGDGAMLKSRHKRLRFARKCLQQLGQAVLGFCRHNVRQTVGGEWLEMEDGDV